MALMPPQPSPWGWVPPEWDTSGGVADQPLVDPMAGGWPSAEWGAPAESPVPDVALATPEAAQASAAADSLFADDAPAAWEMGPLEVEDDGEEPQAWEMGDAVIEPEGGEIAQTLDEEDDAEIDLTPDAITGGESPPPLAPPQPALGTKPKTPEEIAIERGRAMADLAQTDPEAFAVIQEQRAIKAEHERATREAELAAKQREEIEGNEKRRLAARNVAQADLAQVKSEAAALADGSPFQQWFATRSTGQKLAGYISAMLGGLLSPQTGGRNSGIDFMMKLADDDATARWTSLRERKQMAGDALGDADDEFRQQESIRLANYEQVARALEGELAQLDPEGTQARRLEAAIMGARSRQAESLARYKESQYQRADKLIKADQEQQKIDIEAAKAQSEIDKRNAEIAKLGRVGTGGATAAKVKRTAAEWNKDYGGDVPDDGTPLTLADYTQRVNAKKSVKALNEPTELEAQKRNLAVTGPRGQLKQADDSFYNPPAEAAPKTRNMMYTTGQIVADLDRALYLRDIVGGELDQLNSNELQEYNQIEQRVTLMAKGQHEGMSSDSDLKRLGTSLGVANLSSFRSKAHGLKTAREAVVRQMNGWLGANNYTGDPVTWPNSQTKSTKRTAKERAAQDLIKSGAGNDPSHVPAFVAATGPVGATVKAVDWGYGKLAAKTKATPEDDKKMRAFIKGAMKGDAASIQALREIAEGSVSEAFRNQAASSLMVVDLMQRTPDEDEAVKDREEEEAFLKEGE